MTADTLANVIKSRILTVSMIGFLAVALAGCAAQGSSFAGLPDEESVAGESELGDSGIQAFWLHEGTEIAVALWGSSTCPVIGSVIHVVEPKHEGNTVSIDTNSIPDDKVCTRDYVPHTTVFYTPGAITTTEPLTIQVLDQEITLPAK